MQGELIYKLHEHKLYFKILKVFYLIILGKHSKGSENSCFNLNNNHLRQRHNIVSKPLIYKKFLKSNNTLMKPPVIKHF